MKGGPPITGRCLDFGAPVVGPVETAPGGRWKFLRVHFKIWPGQGGLIEITFRQRIISAMRTFCPTYADWRVPVTYRTVTAAKNLKDPGPLHSRVTPHGESAGIGASLITGSRVDDDGPRLAKLPSTLRQ
jgi:hypothetical protein